MMLQFTAISYICIFWTVIYLCDSFFKLSSKYSSRYISLIIQNGVIISLGHIRWYTIRFNKYFSYIGSLKSLLLRTWFDCGVVFSLITMVISIVILCKMISNSIFYDSIGEQILTPVMPGINLPANQLGYYLVTLLICGIFHEVGHAIAAIREGVKVNGFGLFLLVLYPGAFVDVSTDHINAIHPWRQLRIYCAGVWHNLAIVMLTIGALILMPILFLPIYKTSQGIIVTYIKEDSVVSGVNGLFELDIISKINKCSVTSLIDWSNCLNEMMISPNQGYCLQTSSERKYFKDSFFKNENGVGDCCVNESQSHICFSSINNLLSQTYICLPARSTVEGKSCYKNADCHANGLASEEDVHNLCVTPFADNITKLLSIERLNKKNMLFFGNPLHLYYSISVSNYIPKYYFSPLHLPYIIETFAKYIISLSGALAIFNVVPCYALDGQWITFALVDIVFRRTIQRKAIRTRISNCIIFTGTLLVAFNILLAFWLLFAR